MIILIKYYDFTHFFYIIIKERNARLPKAD